MPEIALPCLNTNDINWILANSCQQQVAANTAMSEFSNNTDSLYIVVDGMLSGTVKKHLEKSFIQSIFTAKKESSLDIEVAQLSAGDVFGEVFSLNLMPERIVKTIENTTIITLNRQKLQTKLQQDAEFASRFYRAIGVLILNRLDFCINKYIRPEGLKIPSLQDVPLLFGELNDSDIDWLIEYSRLESIATSTILIEQENPVDTVYLLLQGNVSVESLKNRITATKHFFLTFNCQQQSKESTYEFARITRGEMIGEMTLLDARWPAYIYKALENLQVLALNRQQLLLELEHNPKKATRFFKAIAMVLSARLEALINQLENGTKSHRLTQKLSGSEPAGEEIEFEAMDNITLGGIRFNWMLKRLKILV